MPQKIEGAPRVWYLVRFEGGQVLDTYATDALDLARVIQRYAQGLTQQEHYRVDIDFVRGAGTVGNIHFAIEEQSRGNTRT